jgi:hypothetical protein
MGDTMNTRRLLSATAVLYWLIAFMKIFATRTFYAPSGIDITERVATIPQAEGAAFIGLGVVNRKSRSLSDDRAIASVLSSNLIWHIVTVVIAVRAQRRHLFAKRYAAAGTAILHGSLALGFVILLARNARRSSRIKPPWEDAGRESQ